MKHTIFIHSVSSYKDVVDTNTVQTFSIWNVGQCSIYYVKIILNKYFWKILDLIVL